MTSLPAAYTAFRERFDPIFEDVVDDKTKTLLKISNDQLLKSLIKQLKLVLLAGGKRSRPYCTELMYRISGGTDLSVIIGPLVGLELFHEFALIHDDVMDRGVLRHGETTLHQFAEEQLRKTRGVREPDHASASLAILFGDIVLSWADQQFEQAEIIEGVFLRQAKKLYASMADEVMMGQMLDVASMAQASSTKQAVDKKMKLKTASYTFVRPMQIGAALAGAEPEVLIWAEKFGTALGMAFQIQDDLLDIISNPKELGKAVLSDLKEGQHTLFTQFVVEHGSAKDRSELRRFFGKPILAKEVRLVRELFYRSGAINYGEGEMSRYFSMTKRLLAELPMNAPYLEELEALVSFIRGRSA